MNDICRRLCELLVLPEESSNCDSWLKQKDFVEFLEENARDDQIIIYASIRSADRSLPSDLFAYSIQVPVTVVSPPEVDDLLKWSVSREAAWNVSEDGRNVRVESSLRDNPSKTLSRGEHLLFTRSFEGDGELRYYIEISQKFSHVCGIHHMPERKAWCRLDKRGDMEDVVREVEIAPSGEFRCRGTIVLFNRHVLDEYAALTGTALVRMFDFDRCCGSKPPDWSGKTELSNPGRDIFYRYGADPGNCRYIRGVQIIPTAVCREEAFRRICGGFEEDERKQEKFIVARDPENRKIEEISYEDGMMFETAFFRPEVLSKYKADREKYSFGEDRIDCRDSWSLEFFDINEEGQVYVFLRHLSYLPGEEQRHWKEYNEKPEARMFRHVFKRFVRGEPYSHYSPLASLKNNLQSLKCEWWKIRSPEATSRAQYPVTGSNDEWRDEILHLDQLLVEGFEEKWLRRKAKKLGRDPKQEDRSLNLLEECLTGLGFEEDHTSSIVSPLREVRYLRNKLKGHVLRKDAEELKKKAVAEHGSYLKQYKNLAAECDEAVLTLTKAFRDPRMNRR